MIVQNLSGRILFQEKAEFLESSIWFQFYASSNKDTFFTYPVFFLLHHTDSQTTISEQFLKMRLRSKFRNDISMLLLTEREVHTGKYLF